MLFLYDAVLGFCSINAQSTSSSLSYTVTIDTTKDDYATCVTKANIPPFTITAASCLCDVFFEQDEFLYLTELRPQSICTAERLREAIEHLIKKNRFSNITVHIRQDGKGNGSINVECVAFWTFSRVKIHGLILGKDTYKQLYRMEPGDPFDEQIHQASLARMEEELKCKGFFDANVTSTYKRDLKTKSIKVAVTINRGPSFSMLALPVVLRADKGLRESVIDGLKAHLEKQYTKSLSHTPYQKKNLTTVALSIKKYLFSQGFLEPKIELQERIIPAQKLVKLCFVITLGAQRRFTFLGNTFFTSDHLLEYLMQVGPSFWMLPPDMLEQELITLYKAKGFKDVSIATTLEQDEIFFMIHEGVRARITTISLQGSTRYKQEDLIKQYFKEVQKEGYYDDYLLQKAIDELSDAYRKDGFFEVNIQHIALIPHPAEPHYRLDIILHEGQPSRIVSIKIPGYEYLEQQGPCALQRTKEDPNGPIFTTRYIAEQRTWIMKQLQDQGMKDVQCTYELKRSGQDVNVLWLLKKHPLSSVRFGKTVVIGTTDFPFSLLKKTFGYREGEPWDQSLLQKTLTRIKELDVFERVHVYPYNPTVAEEKKAVLVKVHKDDRFELRLRPGIALQQVGKKLCFNGLTYKIGGSFIVKNPTNVGDQFRIKADVTKSQRLCEASYRRPFFCSFPIRTIYKLYDNRYQQPGCIGLKKNIYTVTQQGFLTNIAKQAGIYNGAVSIGFEFMETVVQNTWNEQGAFAREIARAIHFEPRLLGKKIPYIVAEPSLVINNVDNSAFPHRGYMTVLSMKGMFPVGKYSDDIYFIRFLAEQSVFITLRKVVFALRCRVGHIFHQQFSGIMPTERFYLGGANSVRSYETDLCPPLGKVCDDGKTVFVPQGGKSMINLNLEARFPLYGKLGGVLFQDIGGLSKTVISQLRQEDLLAATGFGLRYHTPLGPLRFDFGIKWHAKVPDESRYAWFLTFGHAF